MRGSKRKLENTTSDTAGDKSKKLAKMREPFSSYKQISSEDFVKDILESKSPFSTLLVDCRPPSYFRNEKIKGFINAPLVVDQPNGTSSSSCRVKKPIPRVNDSSKPEAVKVLLELCPQLLMHMNRPGCFTDIVVLLFGVVNENLLNLMEALYLWTGDAKTNISFLRDRFFRFKSKFPQWILSNTEESGQPIPWTTAGGITKLVEYAQPNLQTSSRCNSEEVQLMMESVNAHLKCIKSAIQTNRDIRDLKWKKGSLEAVQAVLVEEKMNALVPANVKCPICEKVFPEKIVQCFNGHCVCLNCCKNLKRCSKCSVSYYDVNGKDVGKIRVRLYERLVAALVKVDCSNRCGQKLLYSQVAAHLQVCDKGEYADVNSKLRTEIVKKRTEIESLNERVDTLNNEMLQHEHRWITASPNLVAGVPEKLMEEMYKSKHELANLQATLALEVFMKTPAPPASNERF